MHPFSIGGELWSVVLVPPGDPALVDWTGSPRIATADRSSKIIRVSSNVLPPLLDRVVLHEVAHAVASSHGFLDHLPHFVQKDVAMGIDEMVAQLVESYSVEAVAMASTVLGRPVCVHGICARADHA